MQIDDALLFPLVKLSRPESVELLKEQSRNSTWCYEYGSFPVIEVNEESSFGVDGARLSLPESQVTCRNNVFEPHEDPSCNGNV